MAGPVETVTTAPRGGPTGLCLVTDRRRLAAVTRTEPTTALMAQVSGAIRGGIDIVQIREPDLDSRSLLNLTARLLSLAHVRRSVLSPQMVQALDS